MSFTDTPVLLGSTSSLSSSLTLSNLSTSETRSTLIAHVTAKIEDLTPFTDGFNRANQNLANANWTALATPNAAQISSNALSCFAASAASGGEHKFHCPTLGTPNHYVQFKVKNLGPASDGAFIICRSSSDQFQNFIGVRVANGDLQVWSNVNGTYTSFVTGTYTAAIDDVIKVEVNDTSVALYKNDVLLNTYLNLFLSGGDFAGVYARGADQDPWIDEFEAGAIRATPISFNLTGGSYGSWTAITDSYQERGDTAGELYYLDLPGTMSDNSLNVSVMGGATALTLYITLIERVDYDNISLETNSSAIGTPSVTMDTYTANSIVLGFASRSSTASITGPGINFSPIYDTTASTIRNLASFENPADTQSLVWASVEGDVLGWGVEFLSNPATLLGTPAEFIFSPVGDLGGSGKLSSAGTISFSASGDDSETFLSLSGSTSISFSPVGTADALASAMGSSSLEFTTSAAIDGLALLSGSAVLLFDVRLGLDGSTSLTFSTSGTMEGSTSLDGTTSLVFSSDNELGGSGDLTGASSLSFITTSLLTRTEWISGETDIVFSEAGRISFPIYKATSGYNPALPYGETTY